MTAFYKYFYYLNSLIKGYPLKTISKAMGHSSVSITEKYLRVDDDRDIRPMINDLGNKIDCYQKSGNKNGNTEEKIIQLKRKVL